MHLRSDFGSSIGCGVFLWCLLFGDVRAEEVQSPQPFECRWAEGEMTIDGKADESPWKHAQVIDDFSLPWLKEESRPAKTSKINCYSWHHNQAVDWNRVRATQQFELYGFAGETPPPTNGSLKETGWSLIARVNTDNFFGVDSPGDHLPQQASSITAAGGLVGHYRYLLWKVRPSHVRAKQSPLNSTFFGEIDVHVEKDSE